MSRVTDKPYFTYVLWSSGSRRFYVGISDDPSRRLEQHNQGISRWTARHRPWELVYTEAHPNYQAARKRELQLKAQKSGQDFFALTGLDPARFGRRHAPGS
jgi:putative endonuclease